MTKQQSQQAWKIGETIAIIRKHAIRTRKRCLQTSLLQVNNCIHGYARALPYKYNNIYYYTT